MHDSKEDGVQDAWNRAETAQAGNVLRGVLSQMVEQAPGSLHASEGRAGAFHIWAYSDCCGLSSTPLLLAVPPLPTVSLTNGNV